MPQYKETVKFYKSFVIEAKDAAEANEKLEELVGDVEFSADVENDGYTVFEDEPVECPKCKGSGTVGDDEQTCDRCNGDGSVPFTANAEVRDPAK